MALPRWYPGSGLTLGNLNARAAAIRANLGLAVDPASGLTISRSSSGRTIRGVEGRPIVGTLSGAGPTYTFVQALDSATGWSAGPRSGSARDVNGVTGLAGTRQRLYPDRSGTWRFESIRSGCSSGTLTIQVFYPCQVTCPPSGPVPFANQAVTLFTIGGSPVATGTTDSAGTIVFPGLACGAYCLVVSSPRYKTICLGFDGGGQTYIYTMAPANGYVCSPWGCPNPLSVDMVLTFMGHAFDLRWAYDPTAGPDFRFSWIGDGAVVYVWPAPDCQWVAFVTIGYTRYELVYQPSAGDLLECDPFSIQMNDIDDPTQVGVMTEGE